MPPPRSFLLPLGAAAAGGVLAGLSVPSVSWWPLAYPGLALWAVALWATPKASRRALLGFVFGAVLFLVTIPWIIDLHIAGYFGLTVLQALFYAAGGALAVGRGRLNRFAGFVGMVTLVEYARSHYPWGGFPMGGLAVGQGVGYLAPLARLGGVWLVTAATAALGAGLAGVLQAWRPPRTRTAAASRDWLHATLTAGAAGLAVVVAIVVTVNLPAPRASRPVRVALVQGGGPLGIRAVDVSPDAAFQRHVQATRSIPEGTELDLILWPENVVTTDGPVKDHPYGQVIADLARKYRVPVAAGVVESADDNTRFYNAQVLWGADGTIIGRYDKVHRVPFGEYVPQRAFFSRLDDAVNHYIPRDAVAGTGPGLLRTPAANYAVIISYEGFYGDRARDGVNAGGQVLLIPTNASSYVWQQVADQQVAAAQLRAWETGRDVLQASPTGVSAVVSSTGQVRQRTERVVPAVLIAQASLMEGTTPYLWLGDTPFGLGAVALAAVGPLSVLVGRRRRPQDGPQEESPGTEADDTAAPDPAADAGPEEGAS